MKDLIATVSEAFDYVVIDSSPASVLTDPAVITFYTDAVLFVLRQDYTSAALAGSVALSLSENRAELVGCIFNLADEKGIGYRSYKYGKYRRYGKYRKYGGYDAQIGLVPEPERSKHRGRDDRMIDLHCHVLHDMDDGPSTLEEAVALCRSAPPATLRRWW
jgi:Mrp family chromosome partitioning ATPase